MSTESSLVLILPGDLVEQAVREYLEQNLLCTKVNTVCITADCSQPFTKDAPYVGLKIAYEVET